MKTDKEIQKDIMAELEWDPRLDSSEIGVAVTNGVVTLSGQVDSYSKKIAAENAVKKIKAVKGIAEEIIVKLEHVGERTDREIVEAAISALKWNTRIPDEKITIRVQDGWVTLEGQVYWEYQKKEAERAVENNIGVKGVTNLITVTPLVKIPVVKDAIKKALERSADIEADRITVESNGQIVILRGKVRTWNERYQVERAAWNAPGVTAVENNLTLL